MKHFIEGQFDKLRPMFEEGGSLHWAWPLFEGQETLFLTPKHKTKTGAHVRDRMAHVVDQFGGVGHLVDDVVDGVEDAASRC